MDGGGFLSGAWGECLMSAVIYEHETPHLGRDPVYRDEGPAGQVIAHLCGLGHRRLERAADKLESATQRALRSRAGLQLRPGAPEVWQHQPRARPAVEPPSEQPLQDHSTGRGSSGSSSSGASGSGSSSDSEGPEPAQLLKPFGLRQPLPWQCRMNEAVEEAPRELPPEVLARLPAAMRVERLEKVSDGWHEGYLLNLSGPLAPGRPPRAFLRVWRSQLSYWRLEATAGAALELRAMALARGAGLPTAGCADAGGGGLTGVCSRAPRGELCDWAIFDFVEHAGEEEASRAVRAAAGSEAKFLVRTMARLHARCIQGVDTEPLPRFEDWRQHLLYLADLAVESGHADAVRAVEAVRTSLELHAVPDMPPALCHLDWHLGNALCDDNGELQALIDWEFAGVGDPRLDLARFCRLERWTGDGDACRDRGSDRDAADLWAEYAAARFGPGTDAFIALGPPEPWLAMECALVVVLCAAVCSRAARVQQEGEEGEGEQVRVGVPRCDLVEWIEDLETAKWHLRRMGFL